jgi:hypothetical protein
LPLICFYTRIYSVSFCLLRIKNVAVNLSDELKVKSISLPYKPYGRPSRLVMVHLPPSLGGDACLTFRIVRGWCVCVCVCVCVGRVLEMSPLRSRPRYCARTYILSCIFIVLRSFSSCSSALLCFLSGANCSCESKILSTWRKHVNWESQSIIHCYTISITYCPY